MRKIQLGSILSLSSRDAEVFLQQLRIVGHLRSPITVLVSKKDQALSISRFIAGGEFRAGAANIDDPQVLVEARNSNLRVIDITNLATQAAQVPMDSLF
jgi:esterase/lipase superfamily enzyme